VTEPAIIEALRRIPRTLDEWKESGRITGWLCELDAQLGIAVEIWQHPHRNLSAGISWELLADGAHPAVDRLFGYLEKGLRS
jgi:hypothetical protein